MQNWTLNDLVAIIGYLFVASGGVLLVGLWSLEPLAEAPVLGLRGLKRQRARRDLAWFRALEPTIRWFAGRIARLPVSELRTTTASRLDAAGDYLGLTADEWLAICLLACGAGAMLGGALWIASLTPLLIMVLPLAAFMAVFIKLDSVGLRRRRDIVKSLPSAIDLVALCTSAGMSFPQAVAEVIGAWPNADTDPLAEELRLIGRQLDLGHTRRVALAEFARRVQADEVQDFVAAVTQSEAKGTPLNDVLVTQATVLRQRISLAVEEGSAKAQMKMMGPLVILLLATFAVVVAPIAIASTSWL
jgi:tight adherence protein C